MAKHIDIIEESCEKAWAALKKLNQQELDDKNAKLFHELTDSLSNLTGLKMAEQAEEDGGSSYRGGSYAGGRNMMYYDPYIYGNTYRGGSYGGEEWENMEGASGARYQRRDSMGRFSREGGNRGSYGSYNDGSYESGGRGGRGGNSRNGGSYGSAAEHLKAALREARTEEERESIRRAMRDMESGI